MLWVRRGRLELLDGGGEGWDDMEGKWGNTSSLVSSLEGSSCCKLWSICVSY